VSICELFQGIGGVFMFWTDFLAVGVLFFMLGVVLFYSVKA
jgi:hypothetical protein